VNTVYEQKKNCVECNRLFERRHDEAIERFDKRIYCALQCVEAWRKRKTMPQTSGSNPQGAR
jgi:hypothetical protein